MSLYRPYFTPQEIALLDHTDRQDLTSEIHLLRVLLARVLEACQHAQDLTLPQHTAVVSALSRAGLSLARLVRVQAELHNPLEDLWNAIEQGEYLARQSLGVYDYLSHPSPAMPPSSRSLKSEV